jgi:hypothetical protein
MSDSGDIRCSFTIEEIGKDDPRLKQLREIREEEHQAGFHAMIKLIPGTGELKIENVDIWNQFHLTEEDFSRLKSLGLKGSLQVTGWGTLGYAPYKARTLIVARHQIKEAVDLPQPDDREIIYYQIGYSDAFEVSIWLAPRGKPPLYVPDYQRPTDQHVIKDCGANPLRELDRTRRRPAANMSYSRGTNTGE